MHFRKDKNVMMFYNINFSEINVPLQINVPIYFLLDKCDAALFFLSYILRFYEEKKRFLLDYPSESPGHVRLHCIEWMDEGSHLLIEHSGV